jgi:hypothetical protein
VSLEDKLENLCESVEDLAEASDSTTQIASVYRFHFILSGD